MAETRTSEATVALGAEPRSLYWDRQIEAWKASGQTQASFCRQLGLSVASFRWWKRELTRRSEPRRAAGGKQGSSSQAAEGSERPRLLPVRLSPMPEPAVVGRPEEKGKFYELVLCRGRVLRVPWDFDPGVLQRL